MNHHLKKAITIMTTLISGCLSFSITAHQPSAVDWELVQYSDFGYFKPGVTPDGDDEVVVNLYSDDHHGLKENLLVVFPECAVDPEVKGKPVLNLDEIIRDPGIEPKYADAEELEPRWKACPERAALLLPAVQAVEMSVKVDFLRAVPEGMQVALAGLVYEIPESWLRKVGDPAELVQYAQDLQPAAELVIDLYYRLETQDNTWRAGDYEMVFGSASDAPKVTRDYDRVMETMPVDVNGYRQRQPLPEVAGHRIFELNLKEIYAAGSGYADPDEFRVRDDFQINDSIKRAFEYEKNMSSEPYMLMSADHSHTLSGRFSTKWSTDHTLHPGFGFRVEAWTNETGPWKKLAGDWVHANGYWTLYVPVSENFQGNHLRILYRSYNQYYRPQNQAGDSYSWRDPDQYNIGSTFDAGHRYADTDGGDYNGVGELVDAAMWMWSRLYWNAGVDPVNTSPIEMNYPNTWNNCGGGSPWSCASWSGMQIWLIATHGTQADVVAHELAHALQGKFWDEKWPSDSGGSHTLSGCYADRLGMALTEGFANFMPAWVGYPNRNVADGGFSSGRWALGLDPEKRTSPPSCSNGWENETWVARTFWDLHDKRSDGDDILWFNHMGAIISIYLANPVANDGDALDMRDFETIYRNAASAGHEGYISDIFEQNRM